MKINWQTAKTYEDILYHKADGIVKITINRPQNAMPSVPKPSLNSTTPLWMPAKIPTLVWYYSLVLDLTPMANTPSVPVAIKAFAELLGM